MSIGLKSFQGWHIMARDGEVEETFFNFFKVHFTFFSLLILILWLCKTPWTWHSLHFSAQNGQSMSIQVITMIFSTCSSHQVFCYKSCTSNDFSKSIFLAASSHSCQSWSWWMLHPRNRLGFGSRARTCQRTVAAAPGLTKHHMAIWWTTGLNG